MKENIVKQFPSSWENLCNIIPCCGMLKHWLYFCIVHCCMFTHNITYNAVFLLIRNMEHRHHLPALSVNIYVNDSPQVHGFVYNVKYWGDHFNDVIKYTRIILHALVYVHVYKMYSFAYIRFIQHPLKHVNIWGNE